MMNISEISEFKYGINNSVIKKFIVFLVILIVVIMATNFYKHHLHYYDELAAKKFQMMSFALGNKDAVTANTYGLELLAFSHRTPYPRLAAIFLAKLHFDENNLDQAMQRLSSVVNHKNYRKNAAKKDLIWHMANWRLIKVLLLQHKLQEAKEYLSKGMADQKFHSKYHELQGDLLSIENNGQAAHLAYAKAIETLPPQTIAPWLEVKLADF